MAVHYAVCWLKDCGLWALLCVADETGMEAGINRTSELTAWSDAAFVLLAVMGALDFVMIAVALLTAYNTRSVR